MSKAKPLVKKSTVQILAILLLSTISGFAVFSYTSGVETRIKSELKTANVYIVVSQIPVGTSLTNAITSGLVEMKAFPLTSVPTGVITDSNSTTSTLVAIQALQPGQILTRGNFGDLALNTGSLPIPNGKMAVTISLGDPEHVANFVQPGSEITIFANGQNGASKFTQVLIERTQVLAVGNQVSASSTGPSGIQPSPLITVAVSPSDAQRLIFATRNLSLYLGLRSAGVIVDRNISTSNENLFQ